MATTHVTTVNPIAASGRGNLDGHEILCTCGDRQTTSLSARHARRMGWDHEQYWLNKNAPKRARRR